MTDRFQIRRTEEVPVALAAVWKDGRKGIDKNVAAAASLSCSDSQDVWDLTTDMSATHDVEEVFDHYGPISCGRK